MKTLSNHVILYDNECPMCDLYTRAFVSTGMLDKNGREAFIEAADLFSKYSIDQKRACNEIALVDTQTGKISYGVDSLLKILGNRYSFLNRIFASETFRWSAGKLYSFISYNRKIIVPGRDISNIKACSPSFNVQYRTAYIILAWLITSLVLANYAQLLQPYISATNFYREFLICGGQILFQAVVIMIIDRKKTFEYLGNMMTVSLAGALALMPIIGVKAQIQSPLFFLAYFVCVVMVMFLEHFRRMKIVQLPWIMTVTWVIYRICVLPFIL
jgi:hypothetical protein